MYSDNMKSIFKVNDYDSGLGTKKNKKCVSESTPWNFLAIHSLNWWFSEFTILNLNHKMEKPLALPFY